MARTVALAGIAAFVVAANWLRFEEPRSGGGRPFALAVLALAVIPYARVNLTAGPLWAARPGRTAVAVAAVTVFLVALFAAFACWPIVVMPLLCWTRLSKPRRTRHGPVQP